jgi:hypothetical protein
MTRDSVKRLTMFSNGNVDVKRIALTPEQIERYSLPPNPTKTTDARAHGYSQLHGEGSWELDALTPQQIVEVIEDGINAEIDAEAWKAALDHERENRYRIKNLADDWRRDEFEAENGWRPPVNPF